MGIFRVTIYTVKGDEFRTYEARNIEAPDLEGVKVLTDDYCDRVAEQLLSFNSASKFSHYTVEKEGKFLYSSREKLGGLTAILSRLID